MKCPTDSHKTAAWLIAFSLVVLSFGCGDKSDESLTAEGPSLPELGLTQSVQENLKGACAATARQIDSGVVYCPPVVPRGDLFVHLAGRGLAPDTYTIDLQMTEGDSRFGHWLVAGGNARALAAELKRSAVATRSIGFEGVRLEIFHVRPFSQGGGEQGGHVSVYWTKGGRGYIASIHGYDEEPAALVMARGLIEEMKGCPEEEGVEGSCLGVYPAQSPVRQAPAWLNRRCRQIASSVDNPVLCPPLVPTGRLDVAAAEAEGASGGYLLSLRSPILPGGKDGRWLVQGDDGGTLSRQVAEVAQSSRAVNLDGVPGKIVLTVSPGLGGGKLAKSAVVVWSLDGRDYLIAMKGFENEDLVLQLATAMAGEMRERH